MVSLWNPSVTSEVHTYISSNRPGVHQKTFHLCKYMGVVHEKAKVEAVSILSKKEGLKLHYRFCLAMEPIIPGWTGELFNVEQ